MRIRPYIISGLVLPLVPPIATGEIPSIEQTSPGTRPPAELVASFDGVGAGLFSGSPPRNPSDNSLAVGPDHIIQTVNSQLVVFTKKGKRFDTTGTGLYGPIATNTAFAGFGGVCEARPNGDAVVRYDQLAGRWLIVMPIFRRLGVRAGSNGGLTPAPPGRAAQPGNAAPFGPPAPVLPAAMDRFGNIGIGYSFGGTPQFVGQQFAGRLADDPPGQLTLRETILADGEASQSTTMRWEDYTQTAIDPSDDCTIWYVGDYVQKDATSYSTRIGAFRLGECGKG